MGLQLEPSMDLGLQHVFENGLALLGGQTLDKDPRQVISSLKEIISEAGRGSDVLQSQSLSLTTGTQPAVERFSIFMRILEGDRLSAQLKDADKTLSDMQKELDIAQDRIDALKEMLSAMLDGLRKERAIRPLRSPREFSYI